MIEQLKEPSMCKAVNELFADEIKELKVTVADMNTTIAQLLLTKIHLLPT